MIDRDHALPITRQAELVGISRGNVYYLPRMASEADQRLMKRIDALNLAYPFAGSRMLRLAYSFRTGLCIKICSQHGTKRDRTGL